MMAFARRYGWGVALCAGVSALAYGLAWGEELLFGRAWLEALVLAILLGALIRVWWHPGAVWKPGINLCGKLLLEIAIVLLGASLSIMSLLQEGWVLLLGIVGVVVLAILASYALGRLFGLPSKMAVLVACGNSICGNSAIAAVAPVIGAKAEDVATAIAFTAVLGIVVVLALPLLVPVFQLSHAQYGIVAGMTVYAVPQVLAATMPVSAVSLQVGTLVKLLRVLLLGPVMVVLALIFGSFNGVKMKAYHVLPWFIAGFLLMAAIRAAGLLPDSLLPWMAHMASLLTVLAMAALGLGVDVRKVAAAGPRVTAVVVLGLLGLGGLSLLLALYAG